jgi:O-antigen biosynthesis protein
MKLLLRIVRQLPLLVISPLFLFVDVVLLILSDLVWKLFGRKKLAPNTMPSLAAASVVIPNWNGKDLLEKYLPSVVIAMQAKAGNEVIVVDNGSSDGSAEFIRSKFPTVKLIALPENLGFGGGCNTGVQAAKNDIVVLLNSDMRVQLDFLQPLLDAFDGPDVFAVSCQIFFSDPNKRREESGLTQAWWKGGFFCVRHVIDDEIKEAYPCFYGGGGSCAFDRRKFLELGGFDEVLKPFYLEDTDLGYMAWKRGWRVLYQPRSIVFHEHRGTIGKKFSQAYIQSMVKKNFVLLAWKNVHSWPMLLAQFSAAYSSALLSVFFGPSPERASLMGLFRASLQLPGAIGARWNARSLAAVHDQEAFRRPLGGYYRDRFEARSLAKKRLRVLLVSPYALCPPSHGGAVFMQQTVKELSKHCDVHLIALLDDESERQAHEQLAPYLKSKSFLVRMTGLQQVPFSPTPHAVTEFSNMDLEWLIQRTIRNEAIDVLQLDYTNMGQYACRFERLACCLFEHDIYFQSISRQIASSHSLLWRIMASVEYLRAMRFELKMLETLDGIQVCTEANRQYLLSMQPKLASRTKAGMRAAIEASTIQPQWGPRDQQELLFVGNFRHTPNLEAMQWFFSEVAPILQARGVPFRVSAVGAEPPPDYAFANSEGRLELTGFVDDIEPIMARAAVFLCPIQSGSGVRVKLLEAFARGIPVVSTRVGAEGLGTKDGEYCHLADSPQAFADAIVKILAQPEEAQEMARRGRAYVEREWDIAPVTAKLAQHYQEILASKAGLATSSSPSGLRSGA